MRGRFLLHYHDPEDWRLRNIEKHPCDPGWEDGSYSICHCAIRSNIKVRTKIFDVVAKQGKGVIRSAFEVSKTTGIGGSQVLHFDQYYFADENPIELPGYFIQYRCMKLGTWTEKFKRPSPWSRIVREYTLYEKGQKPNLISERTWNHMVRKTSKICEKYRRAKSSRKVQRECGEKKRQSCGKRKTRKKGGVCG